MCYLEEVSLIFWKCVQKASQEGLSSVNRIIYYVFYSRTRSEEKQDSSTSTLLLKPAELKEFQKDSEKFLGFILAKCQAPMKVICSPFLAFSWAEEREKKK